MTRKSRIIKVVFHEPINGRVDYYFGSIKAVYEYFTAEQIGVGKTALYRAKLNDGMHVTKKCCVSRVEVYRSPMGKS